MQDTCKDYFLTSFMISAQMSSLQERFFLIIYPENLQLVFPYPLASYLYFHGAYCYLILSYVYLITDLLFYFSTRI